VITAKVVLQNKQVVSPGTEYEQVQLTFVPDYADGRNKAWAVATPGLTLSMSVKPEVARSFQNGQAYELRFVPAD
jgi:hypothetical protein